MATSQMSDVIRQLRRAALLPDAAARTDGQLLESFLSRRDEAAIQALVLRHGPMVWGVCRRLLDSHHDAEDAFQATFLVLVRKAASVVPREMVANWLYGVAHQTALKARATAARRRGRERQVTEMPEPAAAGRDLWPDLADLLDGELSRLPDKYRVAVVLCDLEGKTRKEAARQLGLPEGTVASRLTRARAMLARRLARQGLSISGGVLAAVLSQKATACVPASVVSSAIEAATVLAAGQPVAAGVIPARVAALTEGVLRTMLLNKIKVATAVLLVAFACVGGALAFMPAAGQTQPVEKAEPKGSKGGPKAPDPLDGLKLQGTWEVVELVKGGKKELPADDLKGRIVFEGVKFRFLLTPTGKDDITRAAATFELDPAKTPSAIDATITEGLWKEAVLPGIYKLDGDNLKLCLPGQHSDGRPAEFKAEKGDTVLLILKRVKQPGAGEDKGGGKPVPEKRDEIDVLNAGDTAMQLVKTTKDPDAKWMAVRILGSLRYEPAVPLLLESLADTHHYVRANAARALGDMKVATAAKPLTELLKKERHGGVIQQTSLALTRLRHADALPALKDAAKHEDVQTRMWVLQAVGGLGGKRDVPFLAGYLRDDPSQLVQAAAAQAIEQIAGVDFGFPKRSGPGSPDEGLRRARTWWEEHKREYEGR